MPRTLLRSPLPSLNRSLPETEHIGPAENKTAKIAESLRVIILGHQRTTSILFYPLREIAQHFHVSLQTASMALARLEKEGLLISVRGSHTEIPGTGRRRDGSVQGVVGMPLWLFGARYSHTHKFLPYPLGETLWDQNMVLETILYSEVGDKTPDFGDHLLRHRMDFSLWLYPFRHNREAILKLKDAGIRNIIVQHGDEHPVLPAHIITDPVPGYLKVLSFWASRYAIRRILIPEGFEYNRERARSFSRLASEQGFSCEIVPCTSHLVPLLDLPVGSGAERLGIALLDENATAEFTHCAPQAFSRFAKFHRILFGNDTINLPFIEDNTLTVEKVANSTEKLSALISNVVKQWRRGEIDPNPRRLVCKCDTAWRLRRYI